MKTDKDTSKELSCSVLLLCKDFFPEHWHWANSQIRKLCAVQGNMHDRQARMRQTFVLLCFLVGVVFIVAERLRICLHLNVSGSVCI